MVVAAVGDAGMMGELSPVPLGSRQSRHSDGQHRTVADGVGRRRLSLCAPSDPPEMEAAYCALTLTYSLQRNVKPRTAVRGLQVQLYAVPHRHVALTQAHSSTQTELELSVPCLPQHLTKNVTRSTA